VSTREARKGNYRDAVRVKSILIIRFPTSVTVLVIIAVGLAQALTV
jgi:hypothetical protein